METPCRIVIFSLCLSSPFNQSGSSCFLGVGPNFLALFAGRSGRMDHYCLSIENYDVAAVTEKLRTNGLKPRRTANRVYVPDPDGLEVELAAVTIRRKLDCISRCCHAGATSRRRHFADR